MKTHIGYTICLFIGLLSPTLYGQEILTLEQAKEITLANNFGIKIAMNNVEIAENLTERKANNYLPSVSASGGLNGDFGSANQQFNNGAEAQVSNAFTWGLTGSIGADYTIYDQRRAITLTQLQESLNTSNLTLRQTIEQNLLQVYTSYYIVSQLAVNIDVLKETINISKKRLKRAQFANELGQGNGLDVLNAEVDIQNDSVNILTAIINLDTEKRNLNVAMGRDASTQFDILPAEDLESFETIDVLIAKAKEDNTTLLINRQNLVVTELNLDLIDAESRPTINSGLSYDIAYSDNAAGSFVEQSTSNGLGGNIGLAWTLFDGSRSIRRQNSVLDLNNQKLQIDQFEQEIERDIINAWDTYQNELFIIGVQENAVATNEENFKRTEEQFRSGQATSIEFRQAQLNLLNAQVNLTNALYSVKIREIEIKQLAGDLID
jgi:outer membrane protein TolC